MIDISAHAFSAVHATLAIYEICHTLNIYTYVYVCMNDVNVVYMNAHITCSYILRYTGPLLSSFAVVITIHLTLCSHNVAKLLRNLDYGYSHNT